MASEDNRPRIRRAQELPLVSFTDWDSVNQVKMAIRQMENGVFSMAADIIDAMGRDDRITGCLTQRSRALVSLPMALDPRGDKRQAQACANELDDLYEELYPNSALTDLLRWGTLLGAGLGQHLWEYGERRWNYRLKIWHPKMLSYRMDTRSFWVQTMDGEQEVVPGDGQWILYTPYGMDRGWMQGIVRSLYVPWLIRQWAMRDWARYSEVHGLPIRKAILPPNAQKEETSRFVAELANLANESTIATPQMAGGTAGDPNRYDVELLEAMSRNWETFDKLLDRADANIAIAIVGQNLSTEVKGGSFAAATAHQNIRNDILQFDGEGMAQTLRDQSLKHWALLNYGSADLAPMPIYATKPPEDKVQKATAWLKTGEGLTALRNAGIKVDIDEVTDMEGIPTTGAAHELPPDPPKGATLAPGEEPAPPPAKPPPGRPTAKASQAAPPAAIEGQMFVDDLVDDGVPLGAAAARQALRQVLALVEDAKDYESLRAELKKLYGDLDPKRMAALLHQAMVLAELAGMYAARKEAGLPDADEEASGES